MLKSGAIINSPDFPESVEIKSCVQLDAGYYQIAAVGRQTSKYYELVLNKTELQRLAESNIREKTVGQLTAQDLQHFLQYEVFQIEERFSSTRALGSGKLIPFPHQIEAVYGRMLQLPQVRFLLADDPGAGKTIMAGMLIRELIARHSIERVLILVPPLVLKQWQDELKEKFNLDFVIIDRYALRAKRSNPFLENNLCLSSMYWAAKDEVKPFVCEGSYDIVIVDEAHKMAAYTYGKVRRRIARTKLYRLGEILMRKTRNCLLLTATPHKGDMENFRHLLSLLDRDIFTNVSSEQTLREKSNPFIIRRLKENLKNFDGTPIFPKRTTKTIEYHLSDNELELYRAVTEYVRHYFDRAMSKGNNSVAFAMMLLQRRLSSSLEAVHLSLERRRNKLEQLLAVTLEERRKYYRQLQKLSFEDYEDETLAEQQKIEEKMEEAFLEIDLEELSTELEALNHLLALSSRLRRNTIERKYQELEKTLFGINGLMQSKEKILIFTEATDTLRYLERKLLERVPKVATIHGQMSMEERHRQVESFKNDCQIMLATDAGGESINLHFCNQLINYDIPWNPNKLEQRMGRIHRIGQRNEVFIFSLVAANTIEGDVLLRLLRKMEQMREDLGESLVYDFIGDILEDKYCDLPTLMQEAVLNRENLDEVITGMERTLSEEHKKLLEIAKQEMTDVELLDLPAMRREQQELVVKKFSPRCYETFTSRTLTGQQVRITSAQHGQIKRIEYLPRYLRDIARMKGVKIDEEQVYRFTRFKEFESEEVKLLTSDHPLFKLAVKLTEDELEKVAFTRYMVYYPVPEPLCVSVYKVVVTDGTGQELEKDFLFLGKRQNGEIIELAPYCLFQVEFGKELTVLAEVADPEFAAAALQGATEIKEHISVKRERQQEKIRKYLEKAFKAQYDEAYDKLVAYQKNNMDQRNLALINQMNAKLADIERRRERRLQEIERQKKVLMKPPQQIVQLELIPNGNAYRVFPGDYRRVIEEYEKANGRYNVKMFKAFGLVDFYSERFNGEPRYIIVTEYEDFNLAEDYAEDLREIIHQSYLYVVRSGRVIKEVNMEEL